MKDIMVFLVSSVILASLTVTRGEISIVPQRSLVYLEDTVHFSCESSRPYQMCEWRQPDGEVACANIFPGAQSQCGGRSDPNNNLFYNATTTSCGLTVSNIHNQQNGKWSCFLSYEFQTDEGDSAQTELVVFSQGNFECDAYGTINVKAGDNITMECEVNHARPSGDITWKLGPNLITSKRINDGVQQKKEPSENDIWSLYETLQAPATIEEDGQSIYAVYEQRDEDGSMLYTITEQVELSIKYLKIYQKSIPEVKKGQIVDISVEIQSSYEPNVIWMIQGNDRVFEVSEQNRTNENYIWIPTEYQESSSPAKYTAVLRIQNATDRNFGHTFQIRVTGDEDEMLGGKEPVKVNFKSVNDGKIPDGDGPNITLIIIIVVVILVIIILIVVGVVYYTKKNNQLCFAKSNADQNQAEQAVPLQDQSEDLVNHHTATSRP